MKFVCLMFLTLVLFVLGQYPVPDLEPEFEDSASTPEKEAFCVRNSKAKCTGQKCIVSANSVCKTKGGGNKVTHIYCGIRNDIVPMMTIGQSSVDVDSASDQSLDFAKNTARHSLALMGIFEYHSIDDSNEFKPDNGDYITEFYHFGEPADQGQAVASRIANFGVLDRLQNRIGQSDSFRFRFQPDFGPVSNDFPRFQMDAFANSGVLMEKQKGQLKKMISDPSSLKLSINVSNSNCKNSTSKGIGIGLFLMTSAGVQTRTRNHNYDNTIEIPNRPSDTNDVMDCGAPEDGGYMSFKKEVGEKDGMGEYKSVQGYMTVKAANEVMHLMHLNLTQQERLMIQDRTRQALFFTIPKCNLDNFYWDPVLGYDGEIDGSVTNMISLIAVFFLLTSVLL